MTLHPPSRAEGLVALPPRPIGAYGFLDAGTVVPFVPNLGPVGFNTFTIFGAPTGFTIFHFTDFTDLARLPVLPFY